MENLAWLGLGAIGTPMARRLLDAGCDLTVWNRSPERTRELVEAGASAASSPAAAVRAAGVVFVCLTDGDAVEQVAFGDGGIVHGALPGAVVVDHSTIHPAQARAIAQRFADAGIGFVDAPVSGGVAGARAGTLATFLGGRDADVERVLPLVAAYAAKRTHVGGSGAGQLAKSCNQAVVTATFAIWAEMVAYARANGLDPAVLVEAVEGGWADSPICRAFGPQLAAERLETSGALWIKDLGIVADIAVRSNAAIPVTAVVTQRLRTIFGR